MKTILFILAVTAIIVSLFAPLCRAADIIVVADNRLRPVSEIISGMRKSVSASIKICDPEDVKGRLRDLVAREGGKVVVALSREALDEALQLPPAIPVIYDLVVTPPVTSRANTTGFYLATPVREYTDLIRNHLRSIKQVAVVGSRSQLSTLAWFDEQPAPCSAHSVRNTVEFVNTVRRLDTADAIILLPDAELLTSAAMDEVFLLSFRKGIPLMGISEKNVREGALAALVVDMVHVGRMIGAAAAKALKGVSIDRIPPSPPSKFDLFINMATARRMGVPIPGEVIRMAKRVYP
jgi:putative ABC transport system substrate-binding protein